MNKINLLIEELETARKKYGNVLQRPVSKNDVEQFKMQVKNKYDIELSSIYEGILLKTNGFNENGVFLYGTKTNLIEGYSDRYLDGIIEATEMWHENENFSGSLFYGDSDMYLFAQSFRTKKYSIHDRESFNDIIYETLSDEDFFEKIIKLSIDENLLIS